MKPFIKSLLVVVLLFAFTQRSEAQEVGEIAVADFDKISTTGNVHLIINSGADRSSIAPELYGIKNFKYKVKKGVLQIDVATGIFAPKGYLKIVVSTPELSGVEVIGADVECAAPIEGDTFSFTTLGAKNTAKLWVDVDRLVLNVDGSSDVLVGGAADYANLYAALGSRIDATILKIDDLYVKACQGAEIYTVSNRTISAKMTTGATLYWGGAAEVKGVKSFGGGIMEISRANYTNIFDKYKSLDVNRPFLNGGTPATYKPALEEVVVDESQDYSKDGEFF